MKPHKGKRHRHGLRGHPMYCVHSGMMNRCYNPKNISYSRYGGRGIRVSKGWHRLEDFIRTIAPRPGKEYSLDRIDNNGDYTPKNCRWATRHVQANNTRRNKFISFKGRRMTLAQWANATGINRNTLKKRSRTGNMSPKELLRATEIRKRMINWNGRSLRLHQWARETGIPRDTIARRIDKYGWGIEDALSTPVRKILK